jgi:hypothetical protein
MRNRKTLFSSLFIALFLCTIQAFAADWYVSDATGNNGNNGNSWGTAKKTIMAAVTASSTGDNIFIEGGTYQEQVVIGDKSLNIVGSQNGGGRTIIASPAWGVMTTYSLPSDLVWTGAGRLTGTDLKPVVFVNPSSNSYTINITGVDIDGSTAVMPENGTEVFAGLAHKYALGTIGGSGANYIEVRNIRPTSNTNAENNTVGVLFLTRSKPTLQNTRIYNYRNIGIGIIGYSTSSLQSVREDQPYPTIQDCIVTGEDGGTTDNSVDAIQAGIVVANGGHAAIRRNHIHGNRSGNAGGLRIAYGIYTNDARTLLIGDNSVKANGNVISDNEMAIYVRVLTTSLSASLYTFRYNNIVYNGGPSAGLGTPSGKVANYLNTFASHTTYGVARFSHASPFSQTLNLNQNAFGNSEADLFYSYSSAAYSAASYNTTPVAFWRETSGDIITYVNPLSAPVATNLNVNSSHRGSNTSGSPVIDAAYGYTNFEQINKAVYAAALLSVGTVPPRIDVTTNVVENESIIITKPVKIMGSGSSCSNYTSVTLRNSLDEPTIWFYGLSVAVNNLDATNRQPVRDTLSKLRILANDLQAASINSASAPAVLFTGNTFGDYAPVTPVLSFMSISDQFDGTASPQTYSTSQSGTTVLSKRYAPFVAGPYNVKYTRRPENCSTLVADPNVIDYTDNNFLARFRFDNNIFVANCPQLNAAIAAAEGPDPTSIIITENIIGCDAIVNNTETIIMDVVAGKTADIHYLLNPGTGPGYGGGSNLICAFTSNITSGGTHIASRVTVYPPACLQTAIDLISSGPNNVLVTANGSTGANIPFTDVSPVTIAKTFDFRGADRLTAHLGFGFINPGNATYSGKFLLNSGADIANIAGTLTSTKGTIFGSSDNQVDLTFSSSTLNNFGGGSGDAIEMAVQLIGTVGSRRLELTTNNHSSETPSIGKRVFLNGLNNRGTSVAAITLSGSGNCTEPSVLRNLSVPTVIVNSDADCIQTALGIADCAVYTQDIEGVGTNSVNGSGGTVNLNNAVFTQSFAISKSVAFTNGNSTSGTVTLRRGAAVTGLTNFTNTVNLEQCSAFAGAAHPNPQDGIAIATNLGSGVVNIAGYGTASDGVNANGVWSFSNINVNKDVEIRGNYHSTSASDLTCALLAGNSLPLANVSRIANLETVIGTHDGTSLSVANPIFNVTTNGASIKGFTVRNVGSASSNSFVRIVGTASNVEVHNNIVTGTVSAGSVIGLVHDDNGGNKSNIDISNNHYATSSVSQNAILLNRLRDGASASATTNNVISGDFGSSIALEFRDIDNTVADGLIIRNNWVNASASSHAIHFWSVGANTLNGILVEQNHFRGGFVGLSLNTSNQTGSNLFRVRENYIRNNGTGIRIDGNLTTIATNQIFVNNNNLESNATGINVTATTSNSGPTSSFLDLRFNWWGSSLGPVRDGAVASSPSFAGSDSLKVIGHVPFTHTSGSTIADANGATHGRWMIYPAATSDVDGNATCGWQYNDMMSAVLRVNLAGNTLLGNFATLTAASHNGGNTSDQLYVIDSSRYGSTSFGYPNLTSPEPSYPVVFSQAGQPSTIKGLNYPTINPGNTTGLISVTSSFPTSFRVLDYIKHYQPASGNHTVLSFANAEGNTIQNNYFASNVLVGSNYKAISISGGSNGSTHNIINNRINLTNGFNGQAWPGNTLLTQAATTVSFRGVEFTNNAGLSNINVICNQIIANNTNGSIGIAYTSSVASNGIVNIEANNIRTMGVGVHYTFNAGFGFTNNIRTKQNFIANGANGVFVSGTMAGNTVNKFFVNNNDLSNNSSTGINIEATTPDNVSSTNFLDLRFNWWGSPLGPVQTNPGIATIPTLASTDSLYLRGYVPFTHTVGSKIGDLNVGMGRWVIYPAANSGINSNTNGCGWTYSSMMAAVLRVNGTSNTILGTYNTITDARDDVNFSTGSRNTSDQIFVIAKSVYETATFGYDGDSPVESAYPIVFNAADQPSIIRGINRPRILTNGVGTGSISVTSTYPTDFEVKDYIEHVGTTNTYTALNFANNGSNNIENNFITSTVANPTAFIGITISNATANNFNSIDSNRIKLASNPRWPAGPAVAPSAPATFTGIEITGTGANNVAEIIQNDISVAPIAGSRSVGIYANALNISIGASTNTIYGMAADAGNATRTDYWGTGIYLRQPLEFFVNSNSIQGGNSIGTKGHDGITIDRPQGAGLDDIHTNSISNIAPLSGINMSSTRERGYGVKVFSSTGTGNFGSTEILGNVFGSLSSTAPGVASIYVGGTNGTIDQTTITQNDIRNGVESSNASIQIATSQYADAATAPAILDINDNNIGTIVSGESNAMFLAIGTNGVGTVNNAFADNYTVNVETNAIRTSDQLVGGSTIEVADGRPNRASNIRNIFGFATGSTFNGASTAGNGNSGNNTFTHAAILTGETSLADYSTTMLRTENAIAYPNSTDPVVISRLIASPLANATSDITRNTVEVRESRGWSIGSEGTYFKETLTFPDHRVLLNGPRSNAGGFAELLPGAGGTGVMVTSTGRENKDIRGSIRFNTVGAGLFGRVAVGAANKGDVYVQTANVGVDNALAFRHSTTVLPSLASVTGMSNSLDRALDIKAGMDDADDDNYTANTSTLRRTGVFRAGTNSNQFLKETPNAVAGTELMNVFPNPASGDVTVAFKVPVEGMIRVALYDAMGRKVTDLREEYLNIDTYSTTFNAADLPSGTYHVRLMHDLFTVTTSVTVIK